MKLIHYCSGLLLAAFIGMHIFNHLLILHSEELHVKFMKRARKVYRQPVIESLIGLAVLLQIFSGISLLFGAWLRAKDFFSIVHVCSGLYLAFFMTVHVAAVIKGRYTLHLDTNLYYGAGVMNSWPHKLIFIPYYSLGLLSFFFHVACIHKEKMSRFISPDAAEVQGLLIMIIGIFISVAIVAKMSALKKLAIT
jgi:succinate dehydrogenase/fumarate reductase cytochrome b subunit